MAGLTFDDVGHTYLSGSNSVEALEGIDLEIESGQIASIVGSSGCGKTTLLRIAAGLVDSTEGVTRVDGDPIDGIPEEIGLIFQDYDSTLLEWRNVYKNVKIGAELGANGSEDPADIAEEYIDLVGLSEFRDNYITELSGGMRQRVQVARVFAYQPQVLLCDEPFGALDAQTKEIMQEEFLKILKEEGITAMFVTHDIEEAIYMGDVVYTFRAKNPGRLDEGTDTDIGGPLFPKTQYQKENNAEIADLKEQIQEIIHL